MFLKHPTWRLRNGECSNNQDHPGDNLKGSCGSPRDITANQRHPETHAVCNKYADLIGYLDKGYYTAPNERRGYLGLICGQIGPDAGIVSMKVFPEAVTGSFILHGGADTGHNPTNDDHGIGNGGSLESHSDEQHNGSKDEGEPTTHPPNKPPRHEEIP